MIEKYYGKKAALVIGVAVFFLLPAIWLWLIALGDSSKYFNLVVWLVISALTLLIYVPIALREIRKERQGKDPD